MRTSGVADLAGRVLAGRYRLIAPIGTGASGRVYAAWDVRLRRRIAVKVLHAALADDAGFLRRFGAEAQLAASLHHPNVVAVHDWGEDETPFMVLELLEGGSLRAMLDAGARLSPAQAAAVGRQVCAALDYAHARGLVHRDVKPANLLFDEHGGLRVADFGLARALAEASWTEPAGAVLGTIRYAAPEQVHGVVDARSDLYSLALVLVEAMTGMAPFAGETSLASLLARVDRPLPVPAEAGALAPVLERAGRSDPGERWPDAASVGAALAGAAAALPPPATANVRPRRHRRVVPVVVLLLVVVAAATAAFAVGRAAGPRVRVPNLVGRTADAAGAAAGRAELVVRTRPVAADDPAGIVVAQDPEPGTFLATGRPVRIDVSQGPPPVDVPAVAGMAERDARAALEAAGFEVAAERSFDETVARGAVASQHPPPGEPAPPGSEVRLVVSDGPRPVVVPNVVGRTYDDAVEALARKRLGAKRAEAFSASVEAGEVIRQDPVAGEEAARDSVVTIVVSRGPDVVEVPDVRGDEIDDAVEKLERAGLEVDVVGYRPGREVKRQSPSPETTVRRGETVTLFL